MGFNQQLDDVQAKSLALPSFVHSDKWFEYLLSQLLLDSRTLVFHLDDRSVQLEVKSQACQHNRPSRRILDGVGEQVLKNAMDISGIGLN